MSLIGSEILAGASGQAGAAAYEIEQSLRFETNSATEMQKNFSTESNRTTSTTSVWIKRGRLEVVDYCIWSARETANFWEEFTIYSDGSIYALCKYNGATRWNMRTAAVLRDPSAWYHLVYVRDTTNATQADRIRIYVNGERITSWATQTEPASSGLAGFLGGNFEHKLGKRAGYDDETYDGYMAEFHYLDGTANNADSFGEFDDNGVWRPIEYTGGGYGTNGLYLKFDPAATNGIGEDYSGNGHTMPDTSFTTSGTGTDVMSDTPTTNWCTANPLAETGSNVGIEDGNLVVKATSSGDGAVDATIAVPSSGKFYVEATLIQVTGGINQFRMGLQPTNDVAFSRPGTNTDSYGFRWNDSAGINAAYDEGTETSYGTGTAAHGDVVGIAIDRENGEIKAHRNNTYFNSGNAVITGIPTTGDYLFRISVDGGAAKQVGATLNFGQRAFEYTPPTGFKALNTSNLPAPTIKDGSKNFNTVLYNGTGAELAVSGVGFQPDFTWLKRRNNVSDHHLFDVVRGATKGLFSNDTKVEETNAEFLKTFDTDGFTLGTNGGLNASGSTNVAWNWLAGGSGSSNTAGSRAATVSANPSAGFSIVNFTGTGSALTVGHGLGVAPDLMIAKNRDKADNWVVWHNTFNMDEYIFLEAAYAKATTTNPATFWNNTAPTSTVVSVGANSNTNVSGNDTILYCFAEVEGFSKFGKYVSNNSADGPFVFCGFKPELVWLKKTSGSSNWFMYDAARNKYNVTGNKLYADSNAAENGEDGGSTTSNTIDILSNGFKLRTNNGTNNGGDYIFCAWAQHPFGGSGISPATAR